MPEQPPRTDQDVPARAPARRGASLPERDERTVAVPARERPPRDHVDDAGEASFPASDPPSWWGGR